MFLSINTSTNICSVSIHDGHKFQTLVEKNTREHSKFLPIFTQKLIKNNQNKLKYIALCIGPGSFAGLKIGSSFAKGLANSLKIPIVPINNFDVFRMNVKNVDKYYLSIYSHRDYAFSCFNNKLSVSEFKCIKINDINDYPIYGYGFPLELNVNYEEIIPCSENVGLLSMEKIDYYKNESIDKISPIYLYVK